MVQKIDDALSNRKGRLKQIVLEESPFVLEIMTTPLPKCFKHPMIEAMSESYIRLTTCGLLLI